MKTLIPLLLATILIAACNKTPTAPVATVPEPVPVKNETRVEQLRQKLIAQRILMTDPPLNPEAIDGIVSQHKQPKYTLAALALRIEAGESGPELEADLVYAIYAYAWAEAFHNNTRAGIVIFRTDEFDDRGLLTLRLLKERMPERYRASFGETRLKRLEENEPDLLNSYVASWQQLSVLRGDTDTKFTGIPCDRERLLKRANEEKTLTPDTVDQLIVATYVDAVARGTKRLGKTNNEVRDIALRYTRIVLPKDTDVDGAIQRLNIRL